MGKNAPVELKMNKFYFGDNLEIMHGDKILKSDNVKSRIVSKIDSELSFYENEKNNNDFTEDDLSRKLSRRHEILGAIHALESLKKQVASIKIETYSIIGIVEVEDIPIKPHASFLNHVLSNIENTRKYKMIDFSAGSGANPSARPGREEACLKIKKFVQDLDAELKAD